jgi:hypothetical protein
MTIQQRNFHPLCTMDRWLIAIALGLCTVKGILLRSEVDTLWCGTDMAVSDDCIVFTFRSTVLKVQWEMWVHFCQTTRRWVSEGNSLQWKLHFDLQGSSVFHTSAGTPFETLGLDFLYMRNVTAAVHCTVRSQST